jgi:four helix bundle protein
LKCIPGVGSNCAFSSDCHPERSEGSLTLRFFAKSQNDSRKAQFLAIVSNFVEGYGRWFYKGDYLRFLTYSIASCDETKEHIELLTDTGSLAQARGEYFLREYEQPGRDLYRYTQSVAESHQAGFPQTKANNRTTRESQAVYGIDDGDDWETWLREYVPES